MNAPFVIKLPIPPTANTYWRHVGNKVLLSRAGRQYRSVVWIAVVRHHRLAAPMTGRLQVSVSLFAPDRRRRDLDNLLKSLLDALAKAGVYGDDSQIDRLIIDRKRVDADDPHITVEVGELQPEETK